MDKYICIHGHFYQPPRENPWLEDVEYQDSAYPYHDWNERINAECYAPNTASRIIDPEGRVVIIGNNYSKISFNFGPTLLSWMEKHAREIHDAIVDADRVSRGRFSGHGSAMAQAYNHMIMPLANRRDKYTQVIWGIKDFEKRFQRYPEGMWLPETAVDLETLDIMAEYGIKFTVLSPYQAKRTRLLEGDCQWADVTGGKVDPKLPYLCKLPSGRTISLFFYDGPIAQDIAFGGLLFNGENLANRMLSVFPSNGGGNGSALMEHVATDGETYGHHHKYGDMALAYCLQYIESNNLAKITNYGEFLSKFPPKYEAEIYENTSWSCFHGVERWRSNCGCNSGMHAGWNQQWRGPLRAAYDWLRDSLVTLYEKEMQEYVHDPWSARNDYIEVILDRSQANIDSFFQKHAQQTLSHEQQVRALKLLEMQRNALLMYTSCGWFFDEVSGIETVQTLQYSCRALQLAEEISGVPLEPMYIKYLESIPTNIPEFQNGAKIYEMFVKPAKVDFLRVGAHYAIASLFNEYPQKSEIYCYTADTDIYIRKNTGKARLFVCRTVITSNITKEQQRMSSAVIYLGDHNINGGVRYFISEEASRQMRKQITEAFEQGNILKVVKLMEETFGQHNYSLSDLFKDEQRKLLYKIIQPTISSIETSLRQACEENCHIIDYFIKLNIPVPKKLQTIVGIRVNADLENCLRNEVDTDRLHRLVEEVRKWSLDLDRPKLGLIASDWLNAQFERIGREPEDITLIERIGTTLNMLNAVAIPLNLWKCQNIYYSIDTNLHQQMKKNAGNGSRECQAWVGAFHRLGEQLRIRESL